MIARRWFVSLLALPLAGCLEPPVSESLEVRMLWGGASSVSVGVTLRDPEDYGKAPRIQQRIEAEARSLEDRTDAWSLRLRRIAPEREREIIDRDHGRVQKVVRTARLESTDKLRDLFHDTAIDVAYASGADWAELTLIPGPSSRASSAQRQRVDAELASFSAGVAAYAAAVTGLYDYLDAHPDRAQVCFGELFSVGTGGHPTSDEAQLIDRLNDAMGALAAVLDPAPGEPYTLDELSRLVYDPFPAPMRVSVDGEIREREGYPGDLKSELRIPDLSIWSAFARLEGRWLEPDPALALWRDELAKTGKPFDLDGFLALPRRAATPPTESEVRNAIESQLKPAPVYRVRWIPAASSDNRSES